MFPPSSSSSCEFAWTSALRCTIGHNSVLRGAAFTLDVYSHLLPLMQDDAAAAKVEVASLGKGDTGSSVGLLKKLSDSYIERIGKLH
jgi:hypothetical protein